MNRNNRFVTDMDSQRLKIPGFMSMVWGALVLGVKSWQRPDSRVILPDHVGDYAFCHAIKKNSHRGAVAVGVYQRDGKRYVVKRWEGVFRDLHYYALVHEFFVSQILARVLGERGETKVSVPTAVEYVQDAQSFSIIYDFVDGKTLETFPQPEQAVIWDKAQQALALTTPYLTDSERQTLGSRGLSTYLFLATTMMMMLSIFRPLHIGRIIRLWLECLRNAHVFFESAMIVTHRDLTARNILVASDGSIFITDFESATLTFPGYDRAYITVDPKSEMLARALGPYPKTTAYQFLQTYITLHHILGSGEFLRVNNQYFEGIHTIQSHHP